MVQRNPQYLLRCSEISQGDFSHEIICYFKSYEGEIEIEEDWPIPSGYVSLSRRGIRVRVDEINQKRSKIRIPLSGNKLKEFIVNTRDLEEIAEEN